MENFRSNANVKKRIENNDNVNNDNNNNLIKNLVVKNCPISQWRSTYSNHTPNHIPKYIYH